MNQDELIQNVIERLIKLEGAKESTDKDIKILYKKTEELANNVNVSNINIQTILVKIENMDENNQKEMREVKEMLQALTDKPAKNWDKLISGIIGAVVTGLIGYILLKLGLK